MYRILLFITSLLIFISGFAQTPSDSIQAARKAQIEKARAAARAKAEARAAERAKNEAAKQNAENVTDKKGSDAKAEEKADKNVKEEKSRRERKAREEKADNANDSKKSDVKADAKADKNTKEEKSKRERKAREEKTDNADKKASATKGDAPKAEKVKKPSARERNKADSTIAKSKYGPGTFGLRGNIGATIAWSDYSDREHKIGFNSWGFVLNGGVGYRFNHIGYIGVLIDIEAIELLAFSPMLDFVVSAPTPFAPFIELTAGPYVSYDENRKWAFQPRAGLSYRGKNNKVMRFGFGLRMYDDAFDSDSFTPQYAASYTIEF